MIIKIDGFNNISEIKTDFVSSQHYIFTTYLLSIINQNKLDKLNIFEIGGGFGNMRRLISNLLNINSWTIFDMNSVLYFNKEFYKLSKSKYDLFENSINNKQGFYNINFDFRDIYISNFDNNIDFIIATHSLSELDMNEFYWYYNNIIKKSKYLLYCTQIKDSDHNPVSGNISIQKINLLKKIMDPILEIGQPGQETDCTLFIFKNKINL